MLPFVYEAFYQACERESFQVGVVHLSILGWPILSAWNDCIVYRDGQVRLWSQLHLSRCSLPFRSRIKTLS